MENNIKKPYVRFRYTDETLREALQKITSETITLSEASRHYGIPKGTLFNKLRGKVPLTRKMGPNTVLTQEEENNLEKWILSKALLGFPMHPDEVKDSVQMVLKEARRENVFTDDKPGKKWFQLFLKRHPNITRRNAEIISKARASVTENNIREWFHELKNYLKEEGCEDILEDPRRIFNADESGFQTCPKSGKVLGAKNFRTFYEIAAGAEKESITVLCNFSASGESVSPMIIYPYKRIPRDIANSIPEDWAIGRSDSGWMVSSTFYEYIANVFHPWIKEHGIQLPVILFLDGHKSHINMQLYHFCSENNIILYCLLPNATHILQPCDVSIFKSLKGQWKKKVLKYKQQTNKSITKVNFASLFRSAYDNAVCPEIITAGFRACGLYPFSADAIDYMKCISTRRQQVYQQNATQQDECTSSLTVDDYKTALKVIEKHIEPDLLHEFNNFTNQELEKHTSLYGIWSMCRTRTTQSTATEELTYNDDNIINNESETGRWDVINMPVEIDGILYDSCNTENINADISSTNNGNADKKIVVHDIVRINPDGTITSNDKVQIFGTNNDFKLNEIKTYHNNENDFEMDSKMRTDKIACTIEGSAYDKNDFVIDNQSDKTKEGKNTCDVVQEIENVEMIQGEDHENTVSENQSLTDEKNEENVIKICGEVQETETEATGIENRTSSKEEDKINNGGNETNELNDEYEMVRKKEVERKEEQENGNNHSEIKKLSKNANDLEAENRNIGNKINAETALNDDVPQHVEVGPPKNMKEIWSKHLHWPEIPNTNKRKSGAPMPYAITSKKWKALMDEKEETAKIQQEQKLRRKSQLIEKKINKNLKANRESNVKKSLKDVQSNTGKNKATHTATTNSLVLDESETETGEISVGSYVIVLYDQRLFPGQVEKVEGDDFEVKAMSKTGNNIHTQFKWPDREDKIWYNKELVIAKITPPKLIRRGVYECSDIKKFL